MAKPHTKPAAKSKPKAKKRQSTSHTVTWREFKLRIKHTPDYLEAGWSHVELQLVAPKDAPLPITTTGYRSHFLAETELIAGGGAVVLFTAWLDREAKSKAWAKAEFKWRQGDLIKDHPPPNK